MARLTFEHIPLQENDDVLVSLERLGFVLEPVYFQQGVSPTADMLLRKDVAKRLQIVQKGFNSKYRLKIWDAYRPRSVQNAIYASYFRLLKAAHPEWTEDEVSLETEKFVTKADDVSRIPPHATGGAVDLTLVDARGEEVDMGTNFDFFGEQAATLYYESEGRDATVRDHRRTLRQAMQAAGFSTDEDEWWHFDYGNQIWAKNAGRPAAFYGEVATHSQFLDKMV